MTERAGAPRLSAAVGVAIRQARMGRYSLAELARRSHSSVGILSLIERGRGNPSFETLARIADALGVSLASLIEGEGGAANRTPSALRGSILRESRDDAGVLSEHDVGERSTAAGVTVLRPERQTAWRDSMILSRGQEAVVLVRTGTVELALCDRSDEYEADEGGETLSVDISVNRRQLHLDTIGRPRIRTSELLHADMCASLERVVNMSEEVYASLVKESGYASLDQAERLLAERNGGARA